MTPADHIARLAGQVSPAALAKAREIADIYRRMME